GPTPAGSPGTSASRGRCTSVGRFVVRARGAQVHVGLAADLAHEALPAVLELAPAEHVADLGTAVLVADVGLAGAGDLDDVPARRGLELARQVALAQAREHGRELRPELLRQ